jgi:two-component system sensor histidine kinase KdpD
MVAIFRTVWRGNDTTVALGFLMLIMVTASRWRLRYSVFLSLLCTLFYNLFFLPPVGRLSIADPHNWVALAAFLACSVLVSHLSNQEHLQAETAEQRRREVERLYEFSQRLLLQDDPHQVARSTPSAVAAVFGFRAVALYLREHDAIYSSDPNSELLTAVDLKILAAATESGSSVRDGFRITPLVLGMRSAGVLAATEGAHSPQVYEAIGTLVAIALERAAALERSSRLEASRESERLRSALLDSVTHDLRTPLTSIRAAASTLVSHPNLPQAERQELAVIVDEESARLDRLIGQAVEMAQFDAATVRLRREPQDIRELIDTTVEEMRALLRDRIVEVQVESGITSIPMDREFIRRALRHLIENAVRYSRPDSTISISATRDGYRLLLEVADQGSGVDPGDQPFVFDKFYRGRQHQASSQGTGMGLAIVKAIMEAHGGGVALSSAPESGSRFTLWLPLQ